MRSRGPASSKVGNVRLGVGAVAQARPPIVEQHALGVADAVQGRRAQTGGDRRFDEAPPQRLDLQIAGLHPLGPLRNGEIFRTRRFAKR